VKRRDEHRLRATLAVAALEPCFLCGARAAGVGIYQPTGKLAGRLGQPVGKTRLFVHALCETCGPDPRTPARVELRAMGTYGARRATMSSTRRPSAAERLRTPGAMLTRSDLRELGLERRGVDAVFRALDVIVLPGYSRPMIRAEDYLELLEQSTYPRDGSRVR
jgi:hypothetical protein